MVCDYHQSQKAHRSLLYMGIYLYNKLDNTEKNFNPKKLSKFLQKNLHYYFPIYRIIKIDHGWLFYSKFINFHYPTIHKPIIYLTWHIYLIIFKLHWASNELYAEVKALCGQISTNNFSLANLLYSLTSETLLYISKMVDPGRYIFKSWSSPSDVNVNT